MSWRWLSLDTVADMSHCCKRSFLMFVVHDKQSEPSHALVSILTAGFKQFGLLKLDAESCS